MGLISNEISRFAPSTTGPAHPGTLLAGLLCWLDARAVGARVVLRLEDLDPQRCKPEFADRMLADLEWLGLDWDAVERQSERAATHADALERLAAARLLYPCSCSRSAIRARTQPAPDGGWRYPNTCRGRELPAGGWRACREPLRVRLPAGLVQCTDDSGLDLGGDPAALLGDPVVRRRDGAVSYQLAAVVDDAEAGVTRVVRGRDLAPSTSLQIRLQELLGLPRPSYRHHALLLERHGSKLAKFHGAVGTSELRPLYTPDALCGFLAHASGLRPDAQPVASNSLVSQFDWGRVTERDRVIDWNGERLRLLDQLTTSRTDASPGTPTRSGKP